MTTLRPLSRGLRAFAFAATVAATAIFSGCASPAPDVRIVFPNATLNGQPAHVLLDTGAGTSILALPAAKRLGVKSTPASPRFALQWFDATPTLAMSNPVQLAPGLTTLTVPMPVVDFPDVPFDVLIGWPEVQDNILVFDAATHTVRRVEELPPETAGWTKLKMHASDTLNLEVPLPNGHTGIVVIDTGSPYGVVLPPASWKAWKDAHPHARSDEHVYGIPWVLTLTINGNTWADDLTLGPLTLNNVPVSQADWKITSDDFVGTIALAALDRLDLILDGKNGFAYLHPKPSTTKPLNTANWTVDANVQIASNHLLSLAVFNQGNFKEDDGDHAGAIADYSHALELDSPNRNPYLYTARGAARLSSHDFAGAIADFNQVLDLNPQNLPVLIDRGAAKEETGDVGGALADYNQALDLGPKDPDVHTNLGRALSNHGDYTSAVVVYDAAVKLDPENSDLYQARGVTRQCQGNFADALADFNQAIKLQPDDSDYSRLFRELAQLRLGQTPADFPKTIRQWQPSWTKTVGQFILGQLDESALLAAAENKDKEPVTGQRCEAFYYIGEMRLLHRDSAGAREFFQKSVATGMTDYDEYQLARAELARLDAAAK